MKDMIKAMVQEMVAQSIAEVMAEMMGTSPKPQVATAEAVDPVKDAYKPKKLDKDAWLNNYKAEQEKQPVRKDYSQVDLEPIGSTYCKFNAYVSREIWELNDMIISTQWEGHCTRTKKYGYVWKFEDKNKLANFLMNYRIRLEPTEEDKINLQAYRKAKAQRKAEYAAQQAAKYN